MSISIDGPSSHPTSIAMRTSTEDAGDPITEVAVLLAQSFREDRKQALDASDAAEAARVREAERQAQEMREKANSLRQEGWMKGATMALSGGLGLVGACLSIGKSDAVANRTMTGFSGSGKLAEGIGMGFGNSYAATAQEHQGKADLHDARAGAYKMASEKFRDEANEAQRMSRKAMEFLEEVKESRNATAGAASAIRG